MLKNIRKNTLESIKFMSLGAIMLVVPFANLMPQKENYETKIQLNTENAQPLSLPEKKVEITSAGSTADVNNLDPEAVKNIMKAYGQKYGVDWKLVYAIGYHESGNYKSALARNNNNFFGRKASGGGYASWNTPQEGIENEFVYLKTRYIEKGMDTPAKINVVYAEDMSWHFAVEQVMSQVQ